MKLSQIAMDKLVISTFVVLFLGSRFVMGQELQPIQDIVFEENGQILPQPYAGGFNQPQFSSIDWDGDQVMDLFVFDRSGDKALSFRGVLDSGEVVYRYEPSFQQQLPPMESWALMADMNCDGKADLFTANSEESGIKVYQNTSQGGQVSFQLLNELVYTTDSIKLYVATTDVPALIDVDEDGDLDLLSFDPAGLYVRWYERLGNPNCQNLDFTLNTACWGNFMEDQQDNSVILNATCKGNTGTSATSEKLHAGSTLAAVDLNHDGVKELIIGDIAHSNLVWVNNIGSPTNANMSQPDYFFPSNDVSTDIFIFPAAFSLDIDQDGKLDLIAAANASGTSVNFGNIWYYHNAGTATQDLLQLENTSFLEEEMVDCGESSVPVFFDYNGDSLLDLVVGNYLYRDGDQRDDVGLTLYENTGTATLARYQLITRDYLELSSLFNPAIFGASPAFGDLDNDQDQDLILGDLNGKIHYFQNQAGPGQEADFVLVGPEYMGIDVGQQAVPQLVDVNRDGKLDLLIGEQSGTINYYENTGSPTLANFPSGDNNFGGIDVMPSCCTGFSVPFLFENSQGEWELLVAAESGQLFHFNQIEGNLSGNFQELTDRYGSIDEGGRLTISGGDIDNDGKLEWVSGNRRGGLSIFDNLGASSVDPEPDDESWVTLYPNPGRNSILKISAGTSLSGGETLELKIFNLSGQNCFQKSYSVRNPAMEISLPAMPPGLYLIQLERNGQKFALRKWLVF
jgi:hypothetical protein